MQNYGPRHGTDIRQSMKHISSEVHVESLHLFGCKDIEIMCNLSEVDDYQ